MTDYAAAAARDGLDIFVVATVQKSGGAGSQALTWAGSLTVGSSTDRHGLLRYVLDNMFPEDLRGGIVLFYSAEPLRFTAASPTPAVVEG